MYNRILTSLKFSFNLVYFKKINYTGINLVLILSYDMKLEIRLDFYQ